MRIAKFILACVLLLSPCFPAQAQRPTNIPRIGFLIASTRAINAARVKAFLQGLHDLGYSEGKNISIEWRSAEGQIDRLSALAADLVRLHVDVIVTAGPADTKAAKQATSTIPIVMTFDNDPVANGFVASLAHPGGNVTGLSTLAPELSGKQLELLKEMLSKLSRVAVIHNSRNPGNMLDVKEVRNAAENLKLNLQLLDIVDRAGIEPTFRAASKAGAGAALVLGSPVLNAERKEVINLVAKLHLPAMYYTAEYAEDGGLTSYGVIRSDLARRAATFVDKILKGAKPADLPVEQPMKFEFIVNLKAAKQIGLTIPPQVLARADKVIR